MDNTYLFDLMMHHGKNALISLAIFLVGLLISKFIRERIRNYLKSHFNEPTAMLFLVNAAYAVLLSILGIIVLSQLGVPTASLITLLGASSIAIGLALKSSLSNIANGLLLIFLKPFRIGDVVELSGLVGTVEQIYLFTTRIKTPNNELVYIPNAKVMGDKIKNLTRKGTRRIDLTIGISYDANIKKAKTIIESLFQNQPLILKEPAPQVAVKELGTDAVNLYVRPWVKKNDFGIVTAELLESIKTEFDTNGIEIPYPQLDVHLDKNLS